MPLDLQHPDFWTEALQFTPTIHRDIYPSLDPQSDKLRRVANGKVVLITGAAGAFGKGASVQWAKAGAAAIVLTGRRSSQIEDVALHLRNVAPGTSTISITADVSRESDVERLFAQSLDKFSSVDVVVHCAGILGPVAHITEVDTDGWWKAFGMGQEINVRGAFLVARFFTRAQENAKGTFINVGTAASYFASPGQSAYTMSKLTVNMLLDQLNLEYPNLRVFNVHPGMVKSSVLRPELEIYANDTPELFGSFTVALVGDEADFLRGRFIAANWDIDELIEHKEQILSQGLLKNQPFKGQIGPGGHDFWSR